MGPLLAVFLVIAMNQAPADVSAVTVRSFVVEGVGIHPDPTEFSVTRLGDGEWQLHDAFGAPWFVVSASGPRFTVVTADGTRDEVDLGAALGLPDEPWWAGPTVAPPGSAPLELEHLPTGVNVTLEGLRAAEIRW